MSKDFQVFNSLIESNICDHILDQLMKQDAISYSPVKSTVLKVIANNNLTTWPGLTETLIKKSSLKYSNRTRLHTSRTTKPSEYKEYINKLYCSRTVKKKLTELQARRQLVQSLEEVM